MRKLTSDLFHGTSNNHVESIMREGLLPRGNRRSNWDAPYQAQTPEDFVYLTNGEFVVRFHALRTAIANSCPEGLVVKVAGSGLAEDALYPDENYIIGKNVNEGISREQMIEAQARIRDHKHAWRDCLEQRGILAHEGRIDNARIVGVEVIPNEDNPLSFLAGDTVKEFDRRFHALRSANLYFGTPATIYADRIGEYRIDNVGKRYKCHIPCHGSVSITIDW